MVRLLFLPAPLPPGFWLGVEIPSRVYRPRDPTKAPLFGLLDSLYDRVKGVLEELFERAYGFWCGLGEATSRKPEGGPGAGG